MRRASRHAILAAAEVLLLAASIMFLAPGETRAQTGMAGSPPEGIEPLPVDLFTTSNFYFDREYWTDPR